MKKFVTIITALATVVSLSTGVALAATDSCAISVTGPGSINTCTNNTSKNIAITCTNGVSVTNATSQSAVSGTVSVVGNTISGSATSGDAANLNKVATELALNCTSAPAVAVAPPVAPTTPTPVTPAGGQGGGPVSAPASKPAPAAAPKAVVASLPNTGISSVAKNISLATAGLGLSAVAAQAGTVLYRRRALK